MRWPGKREVYAIFLGAGIFFLARPEARSQTVTTYTTASSWQAAVQGSPSFSQNFQSFTKDDYFQTSATNTGPFSLQQVGTYPGFGNFGNFIDVPPVQFTDNSGVTNAALYTKSGLVTVNMAFRNPVFAWGANFYGALSGELENMVLLDPSGNTIASVPVTVDTGFFGFVVSPTVDIQTISFQSQILNPTPGVGQGFGLENVVGACSVTCGTLVLSPSTVNFGNIGLGKSSAPVEITATNNTGSATSLLSSSGLNGFKFTQGTCAASLAVGESCSFTVAFAPTTTGSANGTVTESTSSGPVSLTLTGTGVPANLTFTPASVSFGKVADGTVSAPVAVSVTNSTNSTASFVSESGLSEFHFSGGTCGAYSMMTSLPAGASCKFNVQFAPATAGVANGSFTVATSQGPVTFSASGDGVSAP